MESYDLACKITHFLRYSGRLCSSWITVLVTIERFIAIVYPLHVARMCTPGRIRLTLGTIFCMCVTFSTFPFYTVGVMQYKNEARCLTYWEDPKRMTIYHIMIWISATVGELVVPSVIVSILTTAILVKICTNRTLWKRRLSSVHGQKRMVSTRLSQERQLTRMLVAIALTFVLVRLPYVVFYFLNRGETKLNLWGQRSNYVWISFWVHTAYTLSMCLSTVNYVTNFFFYWCIGSGFRKEFYRLLLKIQRKFKSQPASDYHNGHSFTGSYSDYSASLRHTMQSTFKSTTPTSCSRLSYSQVNPSRSVNRSLQTTNHTTLKNKHNVCSNL